MQKNDTAVIEITDIGVGGEGIGKLDGYTLFIKDAVIGDRVEGKSYKGEEKLRIRTADAGHRSVPAPVEPRCRFARQCGGCQIQEMSYERQLEFKQKKVYDDLVRIGDFDPELIGRVMETRRRNGRSFRLPQQSPVPLRDGQGRQSGDRILRRKDPRYYSQYRLALGVTEPEHPGDLPGIYEEISDPVL